MPAMKAQAKILLAASIGAVLAGCGGLGTNSAPSITSQPTSVSVTTGSSFTLSVTAGGNSLAYQWYKDGTSLSGATSSNYGVTAATADSAGIYYVAVTNAYGTVNSDSATVTVTAAE